MNISNRSTSTSSAPTKRTLLRKLALATALGGSLVGAGLWAESGGGEAPTPSIALWQSISSDQPLLRGGDDTWARTVFLVASDEQAAIMRTNLNESDSVRYQQGLPPMLEEVVVAATAVEADRLAGLILEGNSILAALGREYRVIDLRALWPGEN